MIKSSLALAKIEKNRKCQKIIIEEVTLGDKAIPFLKAKTKYGGIVFPFSEFFICAINYRDSAIFGRIDLQRSFW